jgi:hypothetical protein
MVERLQFVRTRADVHELQLDLVTELGAVEKVAPEIDRERGSTALARRDALKLIEPKTPEVKRELAGVQDVLGRLAHMHLVVDAFPHVVHTIADGLVWRIFDCDRTALAMLAAREVVAKHAPEPGFQQELKGHGSARTRSRHRRDPQRLDVLLAPRRPHRRCRDRRPSVWASPLRSLSEAEMFHPGVRGDCSPLL